MKLSLGIIVLMLAGAFILPESIRGQDFPDHAPLETETLPLRLRPGDTVSVTINPGKKVHATNMLCGGVAMTSLSRWCGGLMPFSRETKQYTLPKALEDAFIDMRLPMTRFYAITQEEPFDTLEDSIDAIALFMDKIKIPKDRVIIECEDLMANKKFSPDEWAKAVAHSVEKKYGFRYWEIGNEVYSSIWGKHSGNAFPTPDDYVKHFISVSEAIREVQPDARIGISVPRYNEIWGPPVLKQAAGHYDFVCPHFYGGFLNLEKSKFEDIVIMDNHVRMDMILKMNRLIKEINPGRDVYIYDSEWGLHGRLQNDESSEKPGPADFQPRNGNIMGTAYRAVRMIYYARENLVRGAAGWKSLTRIKNPGFATLYYTEPETRTMLYWLYYYFNRSLGEKVLDIEGCVPFYREQPLVPMMATGDKDGDIIHIMLVNGSWTQKFPASITLSGFTPTKQDAVYLSDDNLKAFPDLKQKSDFVHPLELKIDGDALNCSVPPHSIVFIRLEK